MEHTEESEKKKQMKTYRGEAALLLAVIINSFGVVLMLRSGSGISAISSVPYAFSKVLPELSLGTWTYIFQGLLVLSLMILRRRFVVEYLGSFVVGFVFGLLLDVHELWIGICRMACGGASCILPSAICSSASASLFPIAASCPSYLRISFPGSCPTSLTLDIRKSRSVLM